MNRARGLSCVLLLLPLLSVTCGDETRFFIVQNQVPEKGCSIPAGTVIGQDPEADARRFHVSPGGVVLVTPEMLGINLRHAR